MIADRYEVLALLGRGGMSFVYRVRDVVAGREVALKLLMLAADSSKSTVAALFEREFHTLAQLRHPHVIAVHDYGLVEHAPYYSMELLDGGDLRERSPLPWRDACRVFFEVCSSIALLHSRRLVHRDISPRNIRCTQDGRAKLIDFGAMVPMNAGAAEVVGTPPFVAPETVHRLALDARTDLFSLGATLYFALTGRMAYPARTFADAMAAWRSKVAPPSMIVPEIPAGLDDLVLALINPEPMRRPQNAFEVMQRLAALSGHAADESAAVSAAYLATPTLVGRDARLRELRQLLAAARLGRPGALLIHGQSGVGRSRMLDAFALEAKTLGFTVLRAAGSASAGRFAVPHALTRHLLETLPSAALEKLAPGLLEPEPLERAAAAEGRLALKPFGDPSLDPQPLQDAFCELWSSISQRWPLLIAVDDLQRIDPSSAAVLAAFLDRSRRAPVFVAFSSDSDGLAGDIVRALARRCSVQELEPLTAAETHALLGSLFGDVANLELLSRELQQIARGNPRQTIDLAQYLVDRDAIRYVAGTWTLPARLEADDLPRGFSDALRSRAQQLSADARFLAEAHALAFYPALRDAQYRALLPDASLSRVEQALSELVSIQAIAGDGVSYTLSNQLWGVAFRDGLEADAIVQRQRALAEMYRPISPIAFIYHAFAGGLDEEALQALQALNARYAVSIDRAEVFEQNIAKMMSCYPRAFEVARQLGASPRAVHDLRRWQLVGATTLEDCDYPDSAREYLTQLEHDSGLDLYRADTEPDPGQRLMRALTAAQQRYLATPEAERVYSIEEALRLLAEYVVVCIMIGGRTYAPALLDGLPQLLEPFVALSPMLDAVWNNAVATRTMVNEGNLESARERWMAVLAKIDNMNTASELHAREIGNAVAYAIGVVEAQSGMPSAISWADRLERDPVQRMGALQLRRIVRLEHGDSKGAERLRRQAEVLSLQSRAPQMFKTLLAVELSACFNAGDLVGVQDVIERMRPLAERFLGWQAHLHHAEGCFHLVRGDYEAARLACEQCLELSWSEDSPVHASPLWFTGVVGLGEALLGLNKPTEARALLQRALDRQAEYGRSQLAAVEIVRGLALAEARLGDPLAALRLEASIAEQQRIGATGVRLGLSYEARAQIAIWQGDGAAFQRYAELTSREYRYGAGSALGARYDRLVNEARRRGLQPSAAISQLAVPTTLTGGSSVMDGDVNTMVLRTLSEESNALGRARAALALICAAHAAERGHLYVHSARGLARVASLGADAQIPEPELVRQFMTRATEHAAELDDMATDELTAEAPIETIELGATRYEPLLLSCVIGEETRVAGVALVETGAATVNRLHSGQLLHAVARHLLENEDDFTP